MKLVCFSEPLHYTEQTTTAAVHRLGQTQGWEVATPDFQAELHTFTDSSSDLVLIVHAAFLKIRAVTVADLRRRCPHARVVTLGSDCAEYLPRFEFDSPTGVDLHLDTMSRVVGHYRHLGLRADTWLWTASDAVLDDLERRYPSPCQRSHDLACLITRDPKRSWPYRRHELVAALETSGLRCQWGGFTPHLEELHRAIASAWVNLGTTTGSWTRDRTMKGWRDWIAPFLHSVLIYDDHTDVLLHYAGPHLPLYRYRDYGQLVGLVRKLRGDQGLHSRLLTMQRAWVREHTIEKQFLRLFRTHGLIS